MTPRAKFRPGGIMLARILSERRFSVGLRGVEPFASGCIFHTSHASPYLHRGLVISLEYNRPRDRHTTARRVARQFAVPSRLLSFVVPVGYVESRTGMRDVSDRRIATIAEKASTASGRDALALKSPPPPPPSSCSAFNRHASFGLHGRID